MAIFQSSVLKKFLNRLDSTMVMGAAIKKAGGNKLSKLDEMEWMELFEAKKKEAQELKSEIERVDGEIDGMVYGLYGLTEEEVRVVEGN